MNCEICGEKYKGIEILIKHEATEKHQESMRKYQNALLGSFAEATLVSAEASATPILTAVPVVDEKVSIPDKSVSIASETIPVTGKFTPGTSESNPVTSVLSPDVAETASFVFDSNNKNLSVFSCTPCSIAFSNISDAIIHYESKLHSAAILATGIGFDELDGGREDQTCLFPVLYYCILCNFLCFHFDLYVEHLQSDIHRRIVLKMKNFFESKEGKGVSENNPKSSAMYCMQCYTQFDNVKRFKIHINGKKHKRILPFAKKTLQDRIHSITLKIENLNYSQVYCEMCNIIVNPSYMETHLKCKTHKRIEQYIDKISCENEEDVISMFDNLKESKKCGDHRSCLYYCELCNIWCFGSNCYDMHLKVKKHNRKTSKNQTDVPSSENITEQSLLFYRCELCNVRYVTSKRYKSHLKSKIHKRIQQLVIKQSKIEENIVSDADKNIKETATLPNYCELCDTQCSDFTSYDKHLKCKLHKKIKRVISERSHKTA